MTSPAYAYLDAGLREALRYEHAVNWPALVSRLLDHAQELAQGADNES